MKRGRFRFAYEESPLSIIIEKSSTDFLRVAQYAFVPFHLDSEGEVSKAYFGDETELGSLKVMLYLRLHYIIRWHDTLRRYRSSRHYESQINCYYTGYTSPLRVFDSK